MSISMSPCRQPALPTRKFWEQDLSGQVPDIRSRVVFEKVGTPLTHAPGRLMRGVRTYIYQHPTLQVSSRVVGPEQVSIGDLAVRVLVDLDESRGCVLLCEELCLTWCAPRRFLRKPKGAYGWRVSWRIRWRMVLGGWRHDFVGGQPLFFKSFFGIVSSKPLGEEEWVSSGV